MKRSSILLATTLLVAIAPHSSRAQTKPFELSLWSPIQVAGEEESISGIRLNILYGRNQSVSGVDVGVVNWTTGDQTGFQFGVVGIVEGDFSGWQGNKGANITRGRVSGVQLSFYNQALEGDLAQIGMINRLEEDGQGLQLGFVNVARNFRGAFIGVANVTQQEGRGFHLGIINSVDVGDGLMIGIVNVANRFHGLQIGVVNIINSKESFPVLPLVNWVF